MEAAVRAIVSQSAVVWYNEAAVRAIVSQSAAVWYNGGSS